MAAPPVADDATQAGEVRDLSIGKCAASSQWGCGMAAGRELTTLVGEPCHAAVHRPAHEPLRPEGSPETCRLTSTDRTTGCGPACPVVREWSSGAHPLLPVPIRVAEFQKAVTTEAHAFLWSAFGQDRRALRWTSPTQRLRSGWPHLQ